MVNKTNIALFCSFNILNFLDTAFTYVFTQYYGFIEANPVMDWLLKFDPNVFILVKIYLGLFCSTYLLYFIRYKLVKPGLITANVLYVLIVAWHLFLGFNLWAV